MNKKHISIVGSCCSREIFNTIVSTSNFVVDRYAFKNCVWDIDGDSLNIDENELQKVNIPDFSKRMFSYQFNKTMIKDFKTYNSKYLLIDLLNVVHDVDKVTFNGKTIYLQDMYNSMNLYKDKFYMVPYFKDMVVERIKFADLDKNLIVNGLKKFAAWAKQNYEEENIVIYKLDYSKAYFDENLNIIKFPEEISNRRKMEFETMRKYEEVLQSLLPNAKILKDSDEKFSCRNLFDVNACYPAEVHYTIDNYLNSSFNLLNVLNLPNNYQFKQSPAVIEHIKVLNKFVSHLESENDNQKKISTSFVKDVDIKNYFKLLNSLNDFIIIISAKDEASNKFSDMKKLNLGLKLSLKFRDSYVAVIDTRRNFIYERVSEHKIDYIYNINNVGSISVSSAGWNAGSISSIKINNKEFSLQKRGLNIVVLNSKNLEVVDQSYCDTFGDSDLKVVSNYLSNIKIKI